jgi:hypothetical protein
VNTGHTNEKLQIIYKTTSEQQWACAMLAGVSCPLMMFATDEMVEEKRKELVKA